jgi:hypothetical protein
VIQRTQRLFLKKWITKWNICCSWQQVLPTHQMRLPLPLRPLLPACWRAYTAAHSRCCSLYWHAGMVRPIAHSRAPVPRAARFQRGVVAVAGRPNVGTNSTPWPL